MKIYKLTDAEPVDFAAYELKKYLRMMMPESGDIQILHEKTASDGFRLGVMSDFGLDTSEAGDIRLDDIVHIDADADGGIIAGSNPRSVLLAVYQFLEQQGCRWLFPGVDGEYIPLKGLEPVFYHKMADHRYRGQCNEGAEAQYNMLETIDFAPKIGLNIYMLEFEVPMCYYNQWYSHKHSMTKEAEPITEETVLQWKRMCETEIAKRGLLFHDMGHGWTCDSFGISTKSGWMEDKISVSEDQKQYLAMIDGERGLFHDVPLNTNFCMSNAEARRRVTAYVCDYAERHQNVDFLHIWLADGSNNHCECEQCVKKSTSDWYIILLNEIDAELTARGLDTRLVFLCYLDLTWPPEKERLNNKKRFTMLFAPITRTYLQSYDEPPRPDSMKPNKRNELIFPMGMGEALAYLNEWKQVFDGDCFAYEYHFCYSICREPGQMDLARCVSKDIEHLSACGIRGIVEDQTQRSCFPTGFPVYLYGKRLFDVQLSFEELKQDYFMHAFGEDWQRAAGYLEQVSAMFDFAYLSGERGDGEGKYHCPEHLADFEKADELFAGIEVLARKNIAAKTRVASVSWQLLIYHAKYCRILSRYCAEKCVGNDEAAKKYYDELRMRMSEDEDALQRYFDLCLYFIVNRNFFEG